jgi:ADP-heptose:LPS heptosyltransferase
MPVHFFGRNFFMLKKIGIRHECCHVIDLVSLSTLGLQLRHDERELDFSPGQRAFQRVRSLLKQHGVEPFKYVVISPAAGWPSRTLPSTFYAELVRMLRSRGLRVVVIGKDVNPRDIGGDNESILSNEVKSVVKGPWIADCVDLSNQLSFHEAGAVFELAYYSVIGEIGTFPLAASTDCPIVYLPQLVPPEFRLPWRRSTLGYGVEVVRRDAPYVGQNYWQPAFSLADVPLWIPDIHDIDTSCDRIEKWIDTEGWSWRDRRASWQKA